MDVLCEKFKQRMVDEKELENAKHVGGLPFIGTKKGTDIKTPIGNVTYRPSNALLKRMVVKLKVIPYKGYNCIDKSSMDNYIIKLIEDDLE